MKKQVSIFLTALLIFSLFFVCFTQETALAATNNWTTARVLLSTDPAASSLSLTLDGSYELHDSSNKKLDVTLQKKAYTITKSGSNVAVSDGSSVLYTGASVRFVQTDSTGTSKIYNSRYTTTISYLGDMLFKQISGQLCVINHVYTEDYLIGVVPYEMNNYYPLEALKAQAICARGYAITKIQSRNAYDYDLVDTSANQVYRGYTTSAPLCTQAIKETAKQILTFNGQVIESIFGDSNGGEIESPGNIWSTAVGGLPPTAYGYVRPDPYDLADSGARTQGVAFNKTIDNNPSYPALQYIQALANATPLSGHLKQDGTPISGAGDIYIKSLNSMAPVYGDPAVDPANDFHRKFDNAKCTHIRAVDINVTATVYQLNSESGAVEPVDIAFDARMEMNALINTYKVFTDTSTRAYFLSDTADGYKITHNRWGHGVGLSQCGAREMAKQGHNYAAILTFYFPNTLLGPTSNIGDKAGVAPSEPEIGPQTDTGTVTASTLNVRSGPGTNYSTLGTLKKGASVSITVKFYNASWHQINYNGKIGYVSKDYINITTNNSGTAPSNPSPDPSPAPSPETFSGTVTASSLNVRSGAGTTYSTLGTLKKGATVTVTKKDYKAGWHQISYNGKTGYVSSSYIKLSSGSAPQQPSTPDPGTSNPDPGTSGDNLTGTVTASTLNVRSGAGTKYSSMGTLKKGATITITKRNYSSGWHQISYNGKTGYVSASYIKIASSGNSPSEPSGSSGSSDKGTVTATSLNVRSGAGTSYSSLGSLKKGATVTITKRNYSSGWHQISYNGKTGYVSAAYIK